MSLFRNLALTLLSLLLLAGCAGFNPRPMEETPFMERAQTQSRGGITVPTAVPSRKEARQIFGMDLAAQRIQPVWVKIQNDTDLHVSVLLTATDPNYFSAREAAYKSHFTLRPGTNRRMDVYFSELSLQPAVAPRSAPQDVGKRFASAIARPRTSPTERTPSIGRQA